MKKIFMVMSCALFIMCSTSLVFAGANANSGAGGTVLTITGTGGGGDLTYSPSPSVQMATNTSATSYAIVTQNSKCDDANGLCYGILQTQAGYSQKKKTDKAGKDQTTKPTAADSLGGDWTYMGAS